MHICVLMANTDASDFARHHPEDGEKFAALLAEVRPDWQVSVFAVKDGIFPPEDAVFDGWLITGSPASVHDPDPWITTLFERIRQIVGAGQPLFGACFGHQAIATALGGKVGDNPGGWVMGRIETQMEGEKISLYAAHREQVLDLPKGATLLGGNAECPVGSFAIGRGVLTTQYHPEMTHGFVEALTDAFAEKLPAPVVARARASLDRQANRRQMAERIARFFEEA